MAVLKLSWDELRLFVRQDVYFFTSDNRPFWQFLTNLMAINQQVEELITEYRERAEFAVESPTVENGAGGSYLSETGGTVGWVAISCTQPGSSGQFVADVLVNGTSIFGPSSNRPVLAFDSSTGYTIVSGANITTGAVPANGLITLNITQAQAGSPRWFRALVLVTPSITHAAATDFDSAVATLAAAVPTT